MLMHEIYIVMNQQVRVDHGHRKIRGNGSNNYICYVFFPTHLFYGKKDMHLKFIQVERLVYVRNKVVDSLRLLIIYKQSQPYIKLNKVSTKPHGTTLPLIDLPVLLEVCLVLKTLT